jgi:LacI family transcriptional regulator
VRVRERAVLAACRRYPDMRCTVRSRAYSDEHGFRTMSELLDSADPPTAVIVGGNQILPGVLAVLSSRDLKPPRDISLITCDEISLSRFLEPPIATLARDPSALGRIAAELLLHRLQGGEPSKHTLPVVFRGTDSCGPPPGDR